VREGDGNVDEKKGGSKTERGSDTKVINSKINSPKSRYMGRPSGHTPAAYLRLVLIVVALCAKKKRAREARSDGTRPQLSYLAPVVKV